MLIIKGMKRRRIMEGMERRIDNKGYGEEEDKADVRRRRIIESVERRWRMKMYGG